MIDAILHLAFAVWLVGFLLSLWFVPWHKMRRERTLHGKIAQGVAIVVASALWFVALVSALPFWQRR